MSRTDVVALVALVSLGIYTLMRPAVAVGHPFNNFMVGDGMVPRGIRNNNPGNIRYDGKTAWVGLANPPTDGEYCIFTEAKYGIRAMARVLASYRRRGLDTIREIISTWAPSSENLTDSYIYSVSQRMGVNPGELLSLDDVPGLIEAIIYHENGQQPYSMAEIREGVALA